MKAAAIGWIFDIPERTVRGVLARSVGPIWRTLRASKNAPFYSISILPVFSEDMPTEKLASWCWGTFPVIANCLWSWPRANITAWWNFDEVLDTQAGHTLTTTRCDVHARRSNARRTLRIPRTCCCDAVEVLDWSSRSSDFNLIATRGSQACSASSNDNQTIPTPSSVMRRIYALMFTGCGMTYPSSINPPINT